MKHVLPSLLLANIYFKPCITIKFDSQVVFYPMLIKRENATNQFV